MISEDFLLSLMSTASNQGIARLVVGAVVVSDNKFLLLERKPDDFLPGLYELPSGKVEAGETLYPALVREVREETGLDVSAALDYIGHFDYSSKSGALTRQFNFLVQADASSPIRLQEHASYVWADGTELNRYPVSDSVKGILARIKN